MRHSTIPDRLEGSRTELHRVLILGQLRFSRLAVAVEVVHEEQPVIEDPEVVAREYEVGRAPAGKPSDIFTGRHVQPGGDLVGSCPALDVVLTSTGSREHWDDATTALAHPVPEGRLRKVLDVLSAG
ncbi:hypothetical protein P3T29_005495 [Kitasatospora sp. MAP5-34]|nr:hypothetical protein [Kitasatospora sp. MAP5-34]